ncbi:MAG: DoxX family protein [Myxococcota bacterium]
MSIALWVLQGLLAFHTITGALWKLSNPSQTVPSLSAIPAGAWKGLSVVEVFVAAAFLLPALAGSLGFLAPVAAFAIVAEMLLFTAVHLRSGDPNRGPIAYWLVVAGLCGLIAFGRLVLAPL